LPDSLRNFFALKFALQKKFRALEKMTESEVIFCYSLMDAAYDCSVIDSFIRSRERIPIIDPNKRGNESRPPLDPAKKERYKIRTEVERANYCYDGPTKREDYQEIAMPRLTEAEYDALEDEITRNPPDVDPAGLATPNG
jgi:hypothetical protein